MGHRSVPAGTHALMSTHVKRATALWYTWHSTCSILLSMLCKVYSSLAAANACQTRNRLTLQQVP